MWDQHGFVICLLFFNKTNIHLSRSLVELQFNEFELICFKQYLPSWSQVSHWSQAKSYLKLLSVSINGILEIPLMRISQSTEILFRNSQTFERLYSGGSRYTRQLVIVMTYLVNTARDVGLLVENRVIENWQWDNEAVSTLFHNPCPKKLRRLLKFSIYRSSKQMEGNVDAQICSPCDA